MLRDSHLFTSELHQSPPVPAVDDSLRPPGVPGVGMTVVSVIIAFYDANFIRRM